MYIKGREETDTSSLTQNRNVKKEKIQIMLVDELSKQLMNLRLNCTAQAGVDYLRAKATR